MDDGSVNGSGAGPVTSVEKLQAISLAAASREPQTEEQAQALSVFRMCSPILSRLLPEDPAELDQLLLAGAMWALSLRSDGAWEPETVEELKEGPAP